jgi:hypothetical protein
VALSRQAVADFPFEHFDWIGMYSGLSESLRIAGAARQDRGLLEEAVTVAEDVVRRAAEGDHPALPGFKQNVGVCYQALAEVDPRISHLARAVESLRDAVAGLGEGPRI